MAAIGHSPQSCDCAHTLLTIFPRLTSCPSSICLFFALLPTGQGTEGDLDVATQQAGGCSRMKVYKDPYSALCQRLGMISRFRASVRLGAGTILLVAILFWILAIVLPLTSLHVGLLASLDHAERQSLPIIAGGASLVGGIMFLLAPRRRRRRRYFDEGGSFSSLSPPTAPMPGHWAFPSERRIEGGDPMRLTGHERVDRDR